MIRDRKSEITDISIFTFINSIRIMKIKNYLALTLMAAVSFAACDKGENGADGDKSPKSVTLTLSNVVPGTRAADDPVAGDSKVTLNDFQVFFAESDGTLVKGKTLQNTDAEHYFAVADFKDENKVFHFLPAEVTKVIVVGNLSEDLKTALASAGSTDDLKRTLSVAAEQDDANLALYDEVELTTVVGEDSAGHPLYKAAMVLEPRVARIEVVGFEYKAEVDDATQAEKERLYESIQVEQIVLNNYYGQAEFVTGAVSGIKTNTPIDAGSVFGFFANAASDWTNDKLDGSQSGRGGGLQDGVRGCRQTPGLPFLPRRCQNRRGRPSAARGEADRDEGQRRQGRALSGYEGFLACRDLRRCQDLSGEIRIRRRRSGESAEMRRGQRGCRCLGCRTGHRPALRFFHRHFHGGGPGPLRLLPRTFYGRKTYGL